MINVETVSRQISALKRDGTIVLVGNRNVTIPDIAALLAETGDEPELSAMIEEFREDEREHRDAALAAGAERAPAYPVLSGLIRLGCRAAIKISERI